MSTNVEITVALLVLSECVGIVTAGSTRFVRDGAFDGFICAQIETVLDMTDVTKIVCASACERHPDCRSMFYLPSSRRCMGCMRKYNTDDVLVVFPGTQHYYDEPVLVSIEQWVMSVTGFSSEDSVGYAGWDAIQVIGPPDVYPLHGDMEKAWASNITYDLYPFIQVQFAEAVSITGVEIYETFHAGGVKAIKAMDGLGNWRTLWSTSVVQDIQSARIFSPILSVMASPSRDLRIELDCTVANTWVEIDAVKLLGTKLVYVS